MKVKTLAKLVIPTDRMEEAIPLLTELRKRITDQPGYLLAEILRKRDQPNAFLFSIRVQYPAACCGLKWVVSKMYEHIHP